MNRFGFFLVVIPAIFTVLSLRILNNLVDKSAKNVRANFGNQTLLVIAHPDDETMFFGPSLINLLEVEGKHVTILSLTNGDGDQKGFKRQKELIQVVKALGPRVRHKIVRDSKLPDGMDVHWDQETVARHIESQLVSRKINTVLTFDSYGVSGHINHRSIYNSTVYLRRRRNHGLNVNFLALQSVPLWRKYTSILDSLISYCSDKFSEANEAVHLKPITLAIGLKDHLLLRKLLSIHKSQVSAFYRQLYMLFSRYMFINDLVPI